MEFLFVLENNFLVFLPYILVAQVHIFYFIFVIIKAPDWALLGRQRVWAGAGTHLATHFQLSSDYIA